MQSCLSAPRQKTPSRIAVSTPYPTNHMLSSGISYPHISHHDTHAPPLNPQRLRIHRSQHRLRPPLSPAPRPRNRPLRPPTLQWNTKRSLQHPQLQWVPKRAHQHHPTHPLPTPQIPIPLHPRPRFLPPRHLGSPAHHLAPGTSLLRTSRPRLERDLDMGRAAIRRAVARGDGVDEAVG